MTPTFGAPVTVTTDEAQQTAEIFIDNDFMPDYVILSSATDLLTSYLNQTVQGDTNIAFNTSTSGRMDARPVDVYVIDVTTDGVPDTMTLDRVDRSVVSSPRLLVGVTQRSVSVN